MIVGFIGLQRHGKTLSMSLFAEYFHLKYGVPIYSNYTLSEAHSITSVNQLYNLQNAIICLDEIHQIMDSRDWKNNIDLSYLITQAGKRKLWIFYTTQFIDQVDKRVRENTVFLYHCQKVHEVIFVTKIQNLAMVPLSRFKINDPKIFYPLFDSFQFLQSLPK